jgi:RNA polymerase-associated protein
MSSRRTTMTLFSAPGDPWSHRTRIVLAEKAVEVEVIDVEAARFPEDLLDLNPYHSVPTLVDRDLVLYDSRVIIEYLDERFPHPPLMPVDPVTRAQFRVALYRIERDWYGAAETLEREADRRELPHHRKVLRDTILAYADLFRLKNFFLSDEFSVLDASIAPVLWRLPIYEIDLPREAQAILRYAGAVFGRESFRASLSGRELEMRLG